VVLCGVSGSTWVVKGPKTWDAAGGHGPGDVRDGCLTMTDGLAAIGDCVVQLKFGKGLVTSSGSTSGLAGRTSADPNTIRKVTSESVDNSCIKASVLDHWVSGTTPKAPKALAASRSLSSKLNLEMAVAEVSEDRVLLANPDNKTEIVLDPDA